MQAIQIGSAGERFSAAIRPLHTALVIAVIQAYIEPTPVKKVISKPHVEKLYGPIPMPQRTKEQRPAFFNLTQIQMPVGSITSILHRITGVLLALGIPLSLYLLQLSLQGPPGYEQAAGLFNNGAFKGLALLLIWALTHHLLAGVRHLLGDIDIGSHLPAARFSAWIVNCSAAAIALLSLGALF